MKFSTHPNHYAPRGGQSLSHQWPMGHLVARSRLALVVCCILIGPSSCGKKPDADSGMGIARHAETVPLKPELAKYSRHWHNVRDFSKIPNLDTTEIWPPIQVPVAAKVLSRGKPVTCSDPKPIEGELKYVIDGEKQCGEGFSLVIDQGPQWVQIDLGASHYIDGVVLWHNYGGDLVVHDLIVQASDDPEFKVGVTTLFNNDIDNSSGQGPGNDKSFFVSKEGRQIPGNGIKSRYIRNWSNGNTDNPLNEFTEVEVWGRPIE